MEGYHVENFGCRASQADGDALAAELSRAGGRAVPAANAAVVVLNTCAVTAEAERTARAWLRRVKRENPQTQVVVTGCYAQRAPQEVARLAGVDAVVGNSHKGLLGDVVARMRCSASDSDAAPAANGFVALSDVGDARGVPVLVDDRFAHANLAADDLAASNDTRPNLKVQDGCGNRCSFCIIPTTRGGSRSVPLQTVLERVRRFVDADGKELVLSGINLGRWGREFEHPARLEDLVAAILDETALPRLRISSVEPMDWGAELLALYRQYGREDAAATGPRLARHAHLPLQSGADATLRAMHRRYRPWHYAEKLAAIREAIPDAAIGADVMVGFPGETDALFEESYRFIAQQPCTYLHLFPFSARPGTAAWTLAHERPVRGEAVRERMARLRTLMEAKQTEYRRGAGQGRLSVVTLKAGDAQRRRGVTPALSDNFLAVEIAGVFPANQMLWTAVSHPNKGEDDAAWSWRVVPN
ncbi:MAG: threonylcarbamoyladenosine tRNA methylthiotransferase MtaB [Acidobacteriaceae bacterium]|nr:threonylcarbamoyladenosine tRNA methylthiotransferase MtaB [Acidobacteriaceae bacterium]